MLINLNFSPLCTTPPGKSFCPFFDWVVCSFYIELHELFYSLDIKPFLSAQLLCPVGCHFLLQGSSWPRHDTRVSCIAGRFFTNWATGEACQLLSLQIFSPILRIVFSSHLHFFLTMTKVRPPQKISTAGPCRMLLSHGEDRLDESSWLADGSLEESVILLLGRKEHMWLLLALVQNHYLFTKL